MVMEILLEVRVNLENSQRAMKRTRPEDSENMSCEICLVKFGIWKRKRECLECRGECCSACLVKEQGGRRICKRCRVLMAVPPDPAALMALKVKDLKQFLCRKHVSHQGCTQKDELVQLVLQLTVAATRPRASPAPSTTSSGSRAGSERGPSNSPQRPVPPPPVPSSIPEWRTPDILLDPNRSSNSSSTSNSNLQQDPPPTTGSPRWNNANNVQQVGGVRTPEDSLASLENLTNEEAIDALSVRQLKLLLLRHFVDYRGCCEKAELQDRVRRLWRQRTETNSIDPDSITNEQLCKICWEVPINCVLLECGHMATCTECGKRMHECPICRQYVVRVVHTFRA